MSKIGLEDTAGNCKRHGTPVSAVGVYTLLGLRGDGGGVRGGGSGGQVWGSWGGVVEVGVFGKEPLIT